MRLAILCNGRDLAAWQRQAIAQLGDKHQLLLLIAADPPSDRRSVRHAAYYALNLAAIRNRRTRRVAFSGGDGAVEASHTFIPQMDERWAALPPDTLQWLRDQRIDAIVKFGLGLLRVPSPDELGIPILSYHHGDPRHYRGRPAGFYELLHGAPFVGQVVQILGNRLDAGQVVAFAQSRVVPHSYKSTLLEAYGLSPFLLPKAVDALESGKRLEIAGSGPNYRLPGNLTVIALAWRMLGSLLSRLRYGLLVEKRWRVALLDGAATDRDPAEAIRSAQARATTWRVPACPRGFTFLADGFFQPDGEVLVEALESRSGKGRLVRLGESGAITLTGAEGHISYPAPLHWEGVDYLLPETASWSPPALFRVEGSELVRAAELDIEPGRLIDPTVFVHKGRVYLFANLASEGASVLHLWSALSPFVRFERHPASPIRVSVRGSRMAGSIAHWGSGLYRIGQDWNDGYGHGILAFRIDALSPSEYRESEPLEAAFTTVRGPHTVNRQNDRLLFDFYTERLTPLAGLRRLAARL